MEPRMVNCSKTNAFDRAFRNAAHDARWVGKDQIGSKLRRLERLLRRHDRDCYEIGDLVVEMVDGHRLSLGFLSKRICYSKSRLSEFLGCCRLFAKGQRESYSFQDSLLARAIYRRMPALNLSPTVIRKQIAAMRGKKYRQIREHFVRLLLEEERNQTMAKTIGIVKRSKGLLDRCHHADFREILPLLPDASAKLIIADPPYPGYCLSDDGGYASARSSTNGIRTDCDSRSDSDALQVTLALFSTCKSKMAPGGVLLLFQPGAKPDNTEILMEAMKEGWECAYALSWVKSSIAPAKCIGPYAPASERILLFARKGDRLQWHEPRQNRSDILMFPSVTLQVTVKMEQGRTAFGDVHMFQKPAELADFLIRKHTFEGELVVEPFGCSGWASIAAAEAGRRWLYVESNAENYAWGSQRIERATAVLGRSAAT